MKILTCTQIRELDKYTIEHEPIKSIDLMERAAKALTRGITSVWSSDTQIVVFAGPGNNGGDALAVARMMAEQGYAVNAYLFNVNKSLSPDCATNKDRIEQCKSIKNFTEVTDEFDPPVLSAKTLVIDGLFGSGLNKPLAGGFASLVKYINQSECKVASIDIPSGLMAENNSFNARTNIMQALAARTEAPAMPYFPATSSALPAVPLCQKSFLCRSISLMSDSSVIVKSASIFFSPSALRRMSSTRSLPMNTWFSAKRNANFFCCSVKV